MIQKIQIGILGLFIVSVNVLNATGTELNLIKSQLPIYTDYLVAENNPENKIRDMEHLNYSDINEIIYIVSKEENISFELLKKEMILKNRIDFKGDRDSKRTLTI